jgi:hypothetical protein
MSCSSGFTSKRKTNTLNDTRGVKIVYFLLPKANLEFDFPELLTMSLNLPRKRLDNKPSKPHPDFPLTANGPK